MSSSPNDREITLVGLLAVLVRHARLILSCTVVMALLFGTLALVSGYRATSSFLPHVSTGGANRFVGLAAQFGVDISAISGSGESVQFYAKLTKSREVLKETVTTRYRIDDASPPATLLQIWDIGGDTEEERVMAAVEKLREQITTSTDLEAGTVALRTVALTPDLAEQVNARLLALINSFNLNKRQTQAAAERQFIEQRLSSAEAELEAAEDELKEFLENNRTYQDSPQLAFEAARLQRRVDLRQQVFTSLSQMFEQARIDEIRNTPLITVLEHPQGSAKRARSIPFDAVLGLIIGILLGCGLAFMRELLRHERAQYGNDYERLVSSVRGIRRLFRYGP
jgi:uncharacterized protein involved in exopolysaccharide biosynthesis